MAQADMARLSKELVTIREDLDVPLSLDDMRVKEPDTTRLRQLFVELEFNTLARSLGDAAALAALPEPGAPEPVAGGDAAGDQLPDRGHVERDRTRWSRARARRAYIAFDTETVIDADSPQKVDPLRCSLVAISIAIGPGEAYYLPLAPSRVPAGAGRPAAGRTRDARERLATRRTRRSRRSRAREEGAKAAEPASIAARALARGARRPRCRTCPRSTRRRWRRCASCSRTRGPKTAQNAKYDMLVLRRAGVTLRGLDFDTMLASYVLDPGPPLARPRPARARVPRPHDDERTRSCAARGRTQLPFDVVPVDARARLLVRGRRHHAAAARAASSRSSRRSSSTTLFSDIEVPLVGVLAEMEWAGIAIDRSWFASLKDAVRSASAARRAGDLRVGRRGVQHQLQPAAARDPVREARAARPQEDGDRPVARTRACCRSWPRRGTSCPCC